MYYVTQSAWLARLIGMRVNVPFDGDSAIRRLRQRRWKRYIRLNLITEVDEKQVAEYRKLQAAKEKANAEASKDASEEVIQEPDEVEEEDLDNEEEQPKRRGRRRKGGES